MSQSGARRAHTFKCWITTTAEETDENDSVAISAPVFRELPLRRAPPPLSPAMSDRQEVLRAAWLEGQQGRLSAQGEARAWALREAWKATQKTTYGMLSFVASHVTKVGGGQPTPSAVQQFFEKVDADPEWYPGKAEPNARGPKSAIAPRSQNVVAQSAMSMKRRGEEPTYPALVAANPVALLNPATGKPVGKKRVYAILRERCYDDPGNPQDAWSHHVRFSKSALTADNMAKRRRWGEQELAAGHREEWYFKNLVWTDICNSILARTEQRQQMMTLARKGTKGWMSADSKAESKNLLGKKTALKQNSWDAIRVWWAPILTQGKLHVEILGTDFPGETAEGARILAGAVRKSLNIRFQQTPAPNVLFVDRGPGFWATNSGRITGGFKAALEEHNLKTYYKDDAGKQPGNLQEVLLHETAVSWIRRREAMNRMTKPWEETPEEFATRLKGVVQEINDTLNVDGLCRAFKQRVQKLVDRDGDRISH